MSAKKLRTGFSTGSAASAAAKAALTALLTGVTAAEIEISLPQGGHMTIPVKSVTINGPDEASALVIKDAGDDPDATHRAEIGAEVRLLASSDTTNGVAIKGGIGVGTVTRPGLPIPEGEPAVNPVPRQMIEKSLRQVWAAHGPAGRPLSAEVTIFVTDGERIAAKTLNPRLGIVGGLSILGTTGLVKPFSHEAYTATIESALNVAKAQGLKEVVFTTGGKSEKCAMAMRPDLPEPSFIQIADFFGFSLNEAKSRNFGVVGITSFFGKAVKQAQGLVYTHAHQAPMDLSRLASWFGADGAPKKLTDEIAAANTARHALDILRDAGDLDRVNVVGERLKESCRRFLGPKPDLWVRIIDHDGSVLYE